MVTVKRMEYAVVDAELDLKPFCAYTEIMPELLQVVSNDPSPTGGYISVRYGEIPVTVSFQVYCDGTDSGEIEFDEAINDDGTRYDTSGKVQSYLSGLDPDSEQYFDFDEMEHVVKQIALDCMG